jgi:hypothetical protein
VTDILSQSTNELFEEWTLREEIVDEIGLERRAMDRLIERDAAGN